MDAGKRDRYVYSAAIVAPRLPGFLLLPAFAAVLPLADMGKLASAWAFIELFNTLAGLGLRGALGRHFPLAATAAERRETLTVALGGSLAGGLATALIAFLVFSLPALRNRVEFLSAVDMRIFCALLGASILGNLASTLIVYFRAEQKAWSFLAASLIGAALELGLFLFLLATRSVSVASLLGVECVKQAVILLYIAVAGRKDWGLEFSGAATKRMLRFGFWLVPVGLCEWVINSSDRFWLGQLADLSEVGVYGFLYKFAMPLGVLFSGAFMDATARLYRHEGGAGLGPARDATERYLVRGGALALAAAALTPCGLWLLARLWPVFPEAYLEGLSVFPLMTAILYVFWWGKHYTMVLEYAFRTRAIFLGETLPAAASMVLIPLGIWLCRESGRDALTGTVLGALVAQLILLAGMGRMARLPGGRKQTLTGLAFLAGCLAVAVTLSFL